jgi:hypothetical protein
VSHELRTPANAILGHVDLLLSGALGPLARDVRASLGNIQEAGLGLLVQIERAIKAAQQLPGPSSAMAVEGLLERLEQAWRSADPAPATSDLDTTAERSAKRPCPTPWLRVIAILLHDLGVTDQPAANRPSPSASARPDDTERSPVSEVRLRCHAAPRSYLPTSLIMIETALQRTGGVLDLEPDQLVLTWPSRKHLLHSANPETLLHLD